MSSLEIETVYYDLTAFLLIVLYPNFNGISLIRWNEQIDLPISAGKGGIDGYWLCVLVVAVA